MRLLFRSYLATFVPTYTRREPVHPLQAYAASGEPTRFSKDDAPYIFRLYPCPRLGHRGEEGSSGEVVSAVTAGETAGYGTVAPVRAEPAPTITSYNAYQSAGTETWQAPASYSAPTTNATNPAPAPGFSGDTRFAAGQSPAFSLQANQGYIPQNKYSSGHGVYGYTGTVYPGSQPFGQVGGYGQDAYHAQAQHGHVQSQMMSAPFGGVSYDYSYGRQAQAYPQNMTYRQDASGGLLPTASLQSFNARACRGVSGASRRVSCFHSRLLSWQTLIQQVTRQTGIRKLEPIQGTPV